LAKVFHSLAWESRCSRGGI